MPGTEVTEFYLFPKGIDGLLNIGEVHGLNIADDRYNESLQTNSDVRVNVKQSAIKLQPRAAVGGQRSEPLELQQRR